MSDHDLCNRTYWRPWSRIDLISRIQGIDVDATFEDIKSFLLPKGGKKIKLIHKTENNIKIFSGAIMIDFDTIEEKLTFDQQDLFFNEKELAKITNVLRHAFIS